MRERDGTLRGLIRFLLDFDPAEIAPADAVRGWKSISSEVGFSEDTIQRTAERLDIKFPRWGPPTRKTPVFLPRSKITILRRILMGAALR